MKKNQKDCVYLFPSTQNFFGKLKIFDTQHHLSRCQVLRLLRKVDDNLWCHLFRESLGGRTAERLGRSIRTVYEIRELLDLEREDTAYRYVRKYAEHMIPEEKRKVLLFFHGIQPCDSVFSCVAETLN